MPDALTFGSRKHMNVGRLTAEDLEFVDAIAHRVVELLSARSVPASPRLVSAAELASLLHVDRGFVYRHAEELGAVRLGDASRDGAKPRLRFDPEQARAALSCLADKRSQAENASNDGGSSVSLSRARRRLPSQLPPPGSVLVVRGQNEGTGRAG